LFPGEQDHLVEPAECIVWHCLTKKASNQFLENAHLIAQWEHLQDGPHQVTCSRSRVSAPQLRLLHHNLPLAATNQAGLGLIDLEYSILI